MNKIRIYIATHKNYKFPKNKLYTPISLGGKNLEKVELNDDTLINISEKNKNFCELTALYWIWKNDCQNEIVGLCHYRRYFNFKNNRIAISPIFLNKYLNNNEKNIKEILNDYDIILPKKYKYTTDLESQYIAAHIKEDWLELMNVLTLKYPEYFKVKDEVFSKNEAYLYNMFICKKEILDDYAEWLFDILFEMEKNINISKDFYQSRVFGFLSERLFNLYIYYKKLKVKELEVFFVGDKFYSGIRSLFKL